MPGQRKGGRAVDRFIVFDVETPNAFNDRMSAIGVAVVENGRVACASSFLVDPETHFDAFNVSLTGITPERVRGAPTFPELWGRIGPLFQSGVLAAHNAPFDLRVLACCLKDYGLPAPRVLPYVCTVQMGRRCYPELPNHRLDTLCRYRRIPLRHHQADSDCLACAALLLDYLRAGLSTAAFLRSFDVSAMRTVR